MMSDAGLELVGGGAGASGALPGLRDDGPRSSTRRAGVPALTVLLIAGGFIAMLRGLAPWPAVTVVVDNAGQLLAAVAAAVACGRAALRRGPRVAGVTGVVTGGPTGHSWRGHARDWAWVAAAMGCWAGGQLVWSWYEVFDARGVPFPSWADAGFLAFPVLAAAGLLARLYSGRPSSHRVRDLLDAAVIAGSLLVLSWQGTLAAVYHAGAGDPVAFALSLAYPCGDVVLLTLVLLTLARAGVGDRGPLALLAAGLGGLAVADSVFVYLTTTGAYATGNLISAGWVGGFLLIAAAAHTASVDDRHAAHADQDRDRSRVPDGDGAGPSLPAALARTTPTAPMSGSSWLSLALPYVPLLAAGAVLAAPLLEGRALPVPEVALGLTLVVIVLARQFVVLRENHALVAALRQREAELAHQAFHDPLTGLANRALFLDRVEQLVAWHTRDRRGGAVLFCDLDDFKNVNDSLGHAAGDAYLTAVADRLRRTVRVVDTVARVGGDEFAVLLEAPHDPVADVAARIVEALAHPVRVRERAVPSSVSVGAALLPAPDLSDVPGAAWSGRLTASDLLAAADEAMYRAKAAGKGRHVIAGPRPGRSVTARTRAPRV
jgi:diguanylate cyclase (GGDEF)-like protein